MPAQNLPGLVLDRAHPLSRGLVGWWPMHEGGGTRVNDVSGNNLAGTMANFSMSQSSGWTGGRNGRAVAFDGSDDQITVAHNAAISDALISNAFTFSAWARTDSLASYNFIAYKGSAGGQPGPMQAYWEPSGGGYWMFVVGNGVGGYVGAGSATGAISVGWNFLTFVRDSYQTVYINGQPSGTRVAAYATPADLGTSLCLGCRVGSYFSHGAASQARLYKRALSAVEVAQLYADPMAGARPQFSIARTFIGPPRPSTADRLHNRSFSRIYRRGES